MRRSENVVKIQAKDRAVPRRQKCPARPAFTLWKYYSPIPADTEQVCSLPLPDRECSRGKRFFTFSESIDLT